MSLAGPSWVRGFCPVCAHGLGACTPRAALPLLGAGSGGQGSGARPASPPASPRRFEGGGELPAELEDGDDPAAYVTNLSYYHLVPFETDILD